MFAEEGVTGCLRTPVHVIYLNINMMRSFVDAAESKRIIAGRTWRKRRRANANAPRATLEGYATHVHTRSRAVLCQSRCGREKICLSSAANGDAGLAYNG